MIQWNSLDNHSFLNPKFPEEKAKALLQCVNQVSSGFRGHIFILTSGTSQGVFQDLKWVALNKNAFLSSAEAVNHHVQSNANDVWLHPLPDFHVGGLGIWARSFLSGAKVIPFTWSVDEVIAKIQEHRVTLASLVPAQVFDLVNAGLPCPSSIRAVFVGGGILSSLLWQKANALGWPLLPTYGMTETSSQIATARFPVSNRELRVLPHLEVRENSEGFLEFKGDALLTAYISQSEKDVIVEDPKVNGWFTSSDYGSVEGRALKVFGRGMDFVKIGGESSNLTRLKEVLETVAVELSIRADIAVLPLPDERLGHVIHLVSDQTLSGEEAAAIIQRFNASVLGFEKIRKWNRIEKLPRTELGKLIPAQCAEAVISQIQ